MNSLASLLVLLAFTAAQTAADSLYLDTLDLAHVRQSYGRPEINRGMRQEPLSIGGKEFERGVGTHANSTWWIDLAGAGQKLTAQLGVDDAAGERGTVVFRVWGDDRKLFDSGVMKHGMPAKPIELDLAGVTRLLLQVTDAGDGIDYDHANWASASITYTGTRPKSIPGPVETAEILTPKPGLQPRINGPRVYGCRPGKPFIYRVPTQGERPLTFSAQDLPDGLVLDESTGIITGQAPALGEHRIVLEARNKHGEHARDFRIISGDTLALTPPMGWNHWYAHYDRVTDKMMREAADIMVSSGMADAGYSYVNIDDCWMNAPSHKDAARVGPLRDESGNLIPNSHFPNMKALTDYIHAKGLKAGTYISPGPLTCAGFAGSYQHESVDARRFAEWGFDFLKYDWCSYGHIAEGRDPNATNIPTWGKGAPHLQAYQYPYKLMGDLLQQQSRDIVYNLCQYGMGNVWEWGEAVGGHCWRTAGDLGFELDRIFEVALKNAEYRAWSRPGAWNDPDYLQIGWVGDARGGGLPRPCPLSPNEQYAYFSLWTLMASPLFFSGDMAKLDAFTLNLLCNPEVIEVNQDPLGQSASVAMLNESLFLMVKDLHDGSKAVGLFNRGEFPMKVTAPWAVVGVKGKQEVRDLWRHKDLGTFDDVFQAEVPQRGVVLVRVSGK